MHPAPPGRPPRLPLPHLPNLSAPLSGFGLGLQPVFGARARRLGAGCGAIGASDISGRALAFCRAHSAWIEAHLCSAPAWQPPPPCSSPSGPPPLLVLFLLDVLDSC